MDAWNSNLLQVLRNFYRFTPRHPFFLIALGAVATFFILHQCVIGSAVVRGESMSPTLDPGQVCLLNKGSLRWRAPERGELIAFQLAGDDALCVKRVIGLPGEKIYLDDASVFINQKNLAEPYLAAHVVTHLDKLARGRLTVPPGQYFVLGDNRGASEDSRSYGFVRAEELRGLVITLDDRDEHTPAADLWQHVHHAQDYLRVAQAFVR